MQTSKIKIGGEYAVKRGADIVGIRVDKITTARTHKGTSNTIHGSLIGGEHGFANMAVDPQEIVGDFAEQTALVEKRKAEKEAAAAIEAAKKERAMKVAKHLLKLAGMTQKDHGKIDGDYRTKGPITVNYSNGVEIDRSAVDALVEALKL
jgi:mevalonate kinase